MNDSIPISYLRIWAQKNQSVLCVERKCSDRYLINKDGVMLLMPDNTPAPVRIRQVFQVIDRYPCVTVDDLVARGGTLTRPLYLQVGYPNPKEKTPPKFLTFEDVQQEVESYLSLLMHLDPLQLYVAVRAYENGLVGLPHLTRVAGMLQPTVSLGTLLLKQNLCPWEDLLAGCLDIQKSRPRSKAVGPVASGDFELCGEILVALELVTRTQLEEALKIQSTGDRPLGEILVELEACSPVDIQDCLQTQTDMRTTEYTTVGLLGELLIEHRMVRHDDLHEALRLQKIARQPLDGIFITMGICTSEQIQDFRWRIPGAVLPTTEVNEELLCDWIVMRNLASPRQVEEARRLQKNGRQMLGELLVSSKRCSAQDIQRALDLQQKRRLEKPKSSEKLGQLLVSRRIVSESTLAAATELQRSGRQQLGSTLINLGACSEDDFAKAIQLQFSWRETARGREDKLGEELLKEGAVSQQHLTYALQIQSRAGTPLGKILVEMGSCTPEVIIDTLIRRDERRRVAFGMMVQQHAPRKAEVQPPPTRADNPGHNGSTVNGADTTDGKPSIINKVSSWFFKK